jgi:hypothetical protein
LSPERGSFVLFLIFAYFLSRKSKKKDGKR